MPIGSGVASNSSGLAASGSINALAGGTATNLSSQVSASAAGSTDTSIGRAPYMLVGLLVLYGIWAFLIQHNKVKETLQPANVAANLHNFIVVGIQAVIFIVLAKIAFTKATAMGIPGAATLAQVFSAV